MAALIWKNALMEMIGVIILRLEAILVTSFIGGIS